MLCFCWGSGHSVQISSKSQSSSDTHPLPQACSSPPFCRKLSIWHLGMSPKIKSISKQGSPSVPSPQACTRLAPKALQKHNFEMLVKFLSQGSSPPSKGFPHWGPSSENWADAEGGLALTGGIIGRICREGVCWVVLGKCGRHTLIAHCLYSVWRGCFQSQYRANHLRPSLCLSVEWPID